jgi:hypothetical protein
MNVDDDRETLFSNALETDARVKRREKAKITASADGHVVSGDAESGNGKFSERAGGRLKTKWLARSAGDPVTIVMNRKDAGIVGEAEFAENFERPERTICNGIRGSAIAENLLAGNLLDDVFGATRIFAKFGRLELIDQPMPVRMTGEFVTSGGDFAHDVRELLGNPSEDEKCAVDVDPGERFEQAASVGFDAARISRPASTIDDIGEGFGVKIVLDVDGNDVDGLVMIHRLCLIYELRWRHSEMFDPREILSSIAYDTAIWNPDFGDLTGDSLQR